MYMKLFVKTMEKHFETINIPGDQTSNIILYKFICVYKYIYIERDFDSYFLFRFKWLLTKALVLLYQHLQILATLVFMLISMENFASLLFQLSLRERARQKKQLVMRKSMLNSLIRQDLSILIVW